MPDPARYGANWDLRIGHQCEYYERIQWTPDRLESTVMATAKIYQLGGIWMELRDRKKLARLMIVQGVSQRELARAAGWKSHSYVARLIKGEAKTLETTPALRIAHFLQVGVEDLFLTKVADSHGQSDELVGRHEKAAVA